MRSFNKVLTAGCFALLLAMLITFGPFNQASKYSYASTIQDIHDLYDTQTGYTTTWSRIRTGPTTQSAIVTTDAPGTAVTVYASVAGEIVWGGNSTWYRISSFSSAPQYIYGPLITLNAGAPSDGPPAPSAQGKEIVVSLSHQWLYAYQDGNEVFDAAVMTGRPELPTPQGTYHVFLKLHPTEFYSPWPQGSPYWYAPTYINYALEWNAGGYFLHDSWWHSVYGPGTNGWHYDPQFGWQWGSHGCVAMPLGAAAWLYNWAPIGTTVQIVA